jgi:hypothetical protein
VDAHRELLDVDVASLGDGRAALGLPWGPGGG